MHKMLKWIAWAAFLSFLVGTGGVLYQIHLHGLPFFTTPLEAEKRFAQAQVKQLEVQTETAAIRLEPGTEGQVHVAVTGELLGSATPGDWFQTELSPEGLLRVELREEDLPVLPFGPAGGLTVRITLPPSALERVELHAETGSIQLEQVQGNRIVASTETGEIWLEGAESDKISLMSETGDLRIMEWSGALTAETETGNVVLQEPAIPLQPIDVETSTGNVQVTLRQLADTIGLDLQSEVGRIDVDAKPLAIRELDENRLLAGETDGDEWIRVRTEAGSVRISEMFRP